MRLLLLGAPAALTGPAGAPVADLVAGLLAREPSGLVLRISDGERVLRPHLDDDGGVAHDRCGLFEDLLGTPPDVVWVHPALDERLLPLALRLRAKGVPLVTHGLGRQRAPTERGRVGRAVAGARRRALTTGWAFAATTAFTSRAEHATAGEPRGPRVLVPHPLPRGTTAHTTTAARSGPALLADAHDDVVGPRSAQWLRTCDHDPADGPLALAPRRTARAGPTPRHGLVDAGRVELVDAADPAALDDALARAGYVTCLDPSESQPALLRTAAAAGLPAITVPRAGWAEVTELAGAGAGTVVDADAPVATTVTRIVAAAPHDDPVVRAARVRELLAPTAVAAFHLALLHDVLAGRPVETTDHLAAMAGAET